MPFAGYQDHDDCVAKNRDKSDPDAYCGTIRRKVEEVDRRWAKEQNEDKPESLTTPNAGDVKTEEPQDLTSPSGSSKEAENPQASGRGELSPTSPPQDQAEPKANPQDQAEPQDAGHQKAGEQERDNGDKDYGDKDNGNKDNGDKDEIEYEGEVYKKVKSLEFNGKIYVPKCVQCPKRATENDLDYEGTLYEEENDDVLQLDNDYYVKDEEQAPVAPDVSPTEPVQAPVAVDTPELNPVMESIIIKEANGKYKKYRVFEAKNNEEQTAPDNAYGDLNDKPYAKNEDELKDKKREEQQGKATEQEEEPEVEKPPEVKEVPKIETPQGQQAETPKEPETKPIEQKEPSEELKAVEKIIIKENGKLKFKTVFQEVKKKL